MTRDLAARYDAAAPRWGRTLDRLGFPAAYLGVVRQAMQLLPLPSGQVEAVDLGAGDGAFAEALDRALGPRVSLTLVDTSRAMLRAAETRLGPDRARMIAADLASADLAPESFDLVAAAHVLEHLPNPQHALGRMGGLLRPGGILVLVVSRPHWCSRLVWFLWRHRRFSEAEIRRHLEQTGFGTVHCWPLTSGPPRRLSLAYAARRPAGVRRNAHLRRAP